MALTTEDGVASAKSRVVLMSWGCVDETPSLPEANPRSALRNQRGLFPGADRGAQGLRTFGPAAAAAGAAAYAAYAAYS
jgi:hypothetical protein